MNTAKLIKAGLKGFRGDARLYKLTPSLNEKDYNGHHKADHEYVLVSASHGAFSGPETYIFPANKRGDVTDWGELGGSFKGGLDHKQALENAGYSIE